MVQNFYPDKSLKMTKTIFLGTVNVKKNTPMREQLRY